MKHTDIVNIDKIMTEGTVYDMDKEYGAPAPKKSKAHYGGDSDYSPEDEKAMLKARAEQEAKRRQQKAMADLAAYKAKHGIKEDYNRSADEILQQLTSAYRRCVEQRDSYNNFNDIKTVYELLRDPLKQGDAAEYSKMYAYVSGKYPDAFDQLMDEISGKNLSESFGSNYAEKLAQQVFDQYPDLANEDNILHFGYAIAKKELGSRAQGIFHNEDFPSDFVSAYFHVKNAGIAEGWKEKVGAAALAGVMATGTGAKTPKVPLHRAIDDATIVYNNNKFIKKEIKKHKEKEDEKHKSADKQVKNEGVAEAETGRPGTTPGFQDTLAADEKRREQRLQARKAQDKSTMQGIDKNRAKADAYRKSGVAEGGMGDFGGGGYPKTPNYKVGDKVMVKGYQGVGQIAYIKHRDDVGVKFSEPSHPRVVTTIDDLIPNQGVAEGRDLWNNIGFDVRSDYLWPAMMMESTKDGKSFSNWIADYKSHLAKPKAGNQCILVMVNQMPEKLVIFYGSAIYVGEDSDHYVLRIHSGDHHYTKSGQMLFASQNAFEQFKITLALKFGDQETEFKKMPVMETKKSTATTWEVCFDYGPHQSDTVKVKAGSEDEAIAKVERAAEKQGRSIMINWAKPAEQGVAEGGYQDDSKEREENLRYSRSRNPVADAIRKRLNPNQVPDKERDVSEGSHENIMRAWNSGMSDDELIKKFGQGAFDQLKQKYGDGSIPVPDLVGYTPKEPQDMLVRLHRGLDGPGKALKSIIKQQGVAEDLSDTQKKIEDTILKLEQRLKFAKTDEQWDRISARIERLQAGLNRSKEGVAEGLSRRDFLKRGAIGAGLAATGYGAYKFDKWDTEQEEKFMSLIKDPADLEMYKKLRSDANMYLTLSGGSKDSTYRTFALAKAAEADEFRFKLAKKYNIDLNWIGNVKDKTVDEADKHSMLGKIQRGHELKKKVDTSFTDIGKAQQAGDHPAASKAFRKHERYANLERPGTWTKGVAEAGNKPLEKSYFGMGDTRTPRDIKSQMGGASDEFVKSTADKTTGPFHSKVAKMQGKMAKSELRKREQGVAEGTDSNLSYQGNCTEDDVIEHIFGDVNNFANMVEEHGDEFTVGDLVVKYDPETDIHSFYYKKQGVAEGMGAPALAGANDQRVTIIGGPKMYVGQSGWLGKMSPQDAQKYPGYVLVHLNHGGGSTMLPKSAVKIEQGVAEGSEPGHREIERWATQSEENQKIYNAYIKAGKMADEAYKQNDGASYTGLQLRKKQIRDLIAKKMSEQGVAEGSSGVSVRQWANQVRKDHGADVKFRNRQEGGGAVDSVIAKNSQGETVGVYNRKTGYPTVYEPTQGVAEGEKNPFNNPLGKALYRDLSKEKKASPAQVQRNKERWAKRQAEREQGVAEAVWDRHSQSHIPRDGRTFGQTNHPREEHCDSCGAPTGHAGPGEDSNVDDNGNVYCDDCYADEQGVSEGMNDTVYPNAQVIKSKNGKPVGEIYQDAHGWGCFHYKADNGADGMSSREEAIEELKALHKENGRKTPDYTIKGEVSEQGVAEGFMNKIADKFFGRAPANKYHVGQIVRYEMSPDQPGHSGVGKIEKVLQDGVHYLINGKPVNHFEIKYVVNSMPRGNYSDEEHPISDDGPDYKKMYESKLMEMGAGSVASAPAPIKNPAKVGSLFGGSYSQKNSPFKQKKTKKTPGVRNGKRLKR